MVSCKSSQTSSTPRLWPRSYHMVRCLVQRSHWTLLLQGWRQKSHQSHIALHRDNQWISVPESSTKQWYLVVSTGWCYSPHSSDWHRRASLFLQWVISCFGDMPWPPCLLDVTAPDFFLWGYLKSKVYCNRPTDLHALKEDIREEIAKLSEEILQAVMCSFWTHVYLCIEEDGGHLKDIVHKKWNYVKKKLSTIVNCDVLKLISITFSKMLFLFIISSLFLPQPVYICVRAWFICGMV